MRVGAPLDHRGEVFQVDLVDDARSGRHDAQVVERGLGPAQQLVALAVPLVLALHVEREGRGRSVLVHLHRVVDHEVRRHQRVDPARVAAEVGHRVAHDRQVHDRRDAREVLQDHPRRHERDLGLRRDTGPPRRQRREVLLPDDAAAGVSKEVLEEDLERERGPLEVHAVPGQDVQPVVVGQPRTQRRSGAERIDDWHDAPSQTGRPGPVDYTRRVQEYRERRNGRAGSAWRGRPR